MNEIKNMDLYNYNFDIKTLENNINNLDLNTILDTQKLTVEFCIDYIMNEKYQCFSEESYIDVFQILKKQNHLKLKDFFD
jgi:hypothetical protein